MTEQKLSNLQTLISGKVLRARSYNGSFYTTVICPAKDEYSKPSVVQIRSKTRFLEQINEILAPKLCELSGFEGKSYQATDKDTGEVRQIIPMNLYLDLVE